jgi:tRNA threonylcarbamoyl adenosine modification protein (Sua5/YciO/YrdC/YwlC family)
VAAIRAGSVVAIPTDTVYGLAALPTDRGAIARLVELKGRDAEQPIAVLFDSIAEVGPHLRQRHAVDRLASFWPGALTAVVEASSDSGLVPPVIASEGTIGIRKPDDQVARAVIRGCGGLLAVSSANRHGEAPATSAEEVQAMFGEELLILDGGPRRGGVASTVIDLTAEPPKVLREGEIAALRVLAALREDSA